MATFEGTSGDDSILRTSLSAGVVTDPVGLMGTSTGETNLVSGFGGHDLIESGDGDGYFGDEIYGGTGRDTITGGAGDDYLYGDGGNDKLNASDSDIGVGDDLSGGTGDDTLIGGRGPNFLYGGDGFDLISGGTSVGLFDHIDAGSGNDTIYAANNEWNEIIGGAGADEMHGSTGDDNYEVDDAGDQVIEGAKGGSDTIFSLIATMTLGQNIEDLFFDIYLSWLGTRATGNGSGNSIGNTNGNDTVHGMGGDDTVAALPGDDRIWGEAGNDSLAGSLGVDTIDGGRGNDILVGGYDADCLYGGRGDDAFTYYAVNDSTPTRRDVIGASGRTPAFEGAGKAGGDVIDFASFDADATDSDRTDFVFGGTGKGRLSVVDWGSYSLVRGNIDDDQGFELQVLIADGTLKASAYTAEDFVLHWL